MSAREEQLYSEYEHAVSFYDVTPSGEKYNSVDLEILIQACRERQTALGHIESMRLVWTEVLAFDYILKETIEFVGDVVDLFLDIWHRTSSYDLSVTI